MAGRAESGVDSAAERAAERVSRRAVTFAVAAVFAGSALSSVGCGFLFRPVARSPLESVRLRLRFILLAPFSQVANATNAELRKFGSLERNDVGTAEVRWTVKDVEEEGEDTFILREDANLLIAEFTVHPTTKQDLLGNTGKSQEVSQEDFQSAARKRSNKLFRTVGQLPGVGPAVDRDGIRRDRQFRDEDAGSSVDTQIVELPTTPRAPSSDGGVPDASTVKLPPRRPR